VDNRLGFSAHLSEAAKDIRQKIHEVEERKRLAEIAERLRIQEEKLEAERVLRGLTEDRRGYFSKTLSSLFERWTKGLWRETDPYITKDEIVSNIFSTYYLHSTSTSLQCLK
jgi:hypothetical protein